MFWLKIYALHSKYFIKTIKRLLTNQSQSSTINHADASVSNGRCTWWCGHWVRNSSSSSSSRSRLAGANQSSQASFRQVRLATGWLASAECRRPVRLMNAVSRGVRRSSGRQEMTSPAAERAATWGRVHLSAHCARQRFRRGEWRETRGHRPQNLGHPPQFEIWFHDVGTLTLIPYSRIPTNTRWGCNPLAPNNCRLKLSLAVPQNREQHTLIAWQLLHPSVTEIEDAPAAGYYFPYRLLSRVGDRGPPMFRAVWTACSFQ